MAIFTIGDLHLSLNGKKPMDVFPGWQNYVQRLEENWRTMVTPEDVVVLVGDTSWAMSLEECNEDFAFLHSLPGKKYLLKGNHDYWWCTMAKMQRYLLEKDFSSLSFLHNNCVVAQDMALCGTRSWLFDQGKPHDEKIMRRECGRLIASLEAAGSLEKVAFLHYPPVYPRADAHEIVEILKEYGVRRCFYGHLHGACIPRAVQGTVDGIEYRLVSADALGFCPYKI